MKLQRVVCVGAALALVAGLVVAGEPPDISGTWTVDAGKSDFGPMPAPSDLVLRIAVDGEDFLVHQSGGGQDDLELRFSTSGKEVTNEVPGASLVGIHRWEGEVIVGELRVATDDGTTMTFKDQISCSPDGKVMTMKRDISGPMGDSQITIVMNKQ
jgi:hypothetical protein